MSMTCGQREGFRGCIANVVQWKKWFDNLASGLLQVFTTANVRRAKKEGKLAVLLFWKITAWIEDNLDYLRVFRDLGVEKMQLTYNTQNYSGAGCTEENDNGLTGFGKETVLEMVKLGIVYVFSPANPSAIRRSPLTFMQTSLYV